MQEDIVVMYGTMWCGDCHRAKRVLDGEGVPYRWIDIETEQGAEERMLELNGHIWKVPTILFPDGTVLVEPSTSRLQQHLEAVAA